MVRSLDVASVRGDYRFADNQLRLPGMPTLSRVNGRIAFTAPLARALMGRRTGDVAPLQLGAEGQRLRVERIR